MDPFLSEIFLRQAIVSAPRAFVKPITDNWFTMAKNTSMNYSSLFCVLNSVVPGYGP